MTYHVCICKIIEDYNNIEHNCEFVKTISTAPAWIMDIFTSSFVNLCLCTTLFTKRQFSVDMGAVLGQGQNGEFKSHRDAGNILTKFIANMFGFLL